MFKTEFTEVLFSLICDLRRQSTQVSSVETLNYGLGLPLVTYLRSESGS